MSFTPEFIKLVDALKVEEAKAKVEAYAVLVGGEVAAMVAKYIQERETREAAAKLAAKVQALRDLAVRLDNVPLDMWDQGNMLALAEGIKQGLLTRVEVQVRELELQDGTTETLECPVLRVVAPGMTNQKGAPKEGIVVSARANSYAYFHEGERITIPLTKFIEATYPGSVAHLALVDYSNKDNKSKLSAYDAVKRDPVLKDKFSRKPKAEVVAAPQA